MNATGCLTALNDGGEAFVVLMPDDSGHCRRRTEHTSLPPCSMAAGRPPTRQSPVPFLQGTTAEAYKSRPRRKDRGAFVILPEPPTATTEDTAQRPPAGGCSGRVSPFRGNGFKTPENGRSRASSPTPVLLRRQRSEPRIAAADRRRPPIAKQRLTVSTKDLSAVDKSTATTTPVPVTNINNNKFSPRKKPVARRIPAAGAPTIPPKSPLPAISPKTPRRRPQPSSTKSTVATGKPAVAPKPVIGKPATTRPAANRTPQVKSSPRLPKKNTTAAASTTALKTNDQPSAKVAHVCVPEDDSVQAASATAAASQSATAAETIPTTTVSDSPSDAATAAPTTIAVPVTTAPPVMTTGPTTAVISPITASTSATAIATTHATNAVASPIVDGGPIVSAGPPTAAIAANTLATLSVAGPTFASKPPQSATRPREPPSAAADDVVVHPDPEPPAAQQSENITMTTTPPLSYELRGITVEPEMENQSGRTAIRLTVDSNIHKSSSTFNSSNGHKSVAWARQSEKIIVPTESPQPVETAESKVSAYKRFARKLCGGGGRRRPTVSKRTLVNAAEAAIDPPAKINGRWQKCWPAVWKRRPRLCCQCGAQKRPVGMGKPTATTQTDVRRRQWRQWLCCQCDAQKRPVDIGKPTATTDSDVHRRQWRQWLCCNNCFCKRKTKPTVSRMSSSSISVGALGIAPPITDTFCNKLKRRLCCDCCGCCVVPKFVRRLCCCCSCLSGTADKSNAAPKKKSANRRRSQFKCTGCCTNIPKLDAVFVDHTSVMKGAIPVLPISLAWLCLVFNVIIPGSGTFSSGMLCLCVGKPRFTVNDNFQSRLGSFCVNFIVAVAQLFTVLFCLVGWGWSIWWGMIILKMAKKYQKIKIVDQPNEASTPIDQNHQV